MGIPGIPLHIVIRSENVVSDISCQNEIFSNKISFSYMDRVKRIWYLSPMRAAKVQASLRIRAVSPEPSLLAHTSSESRGTFRQKARSLAPLNGWECAVEICHDGMLDAAHIIILCNLLAWRIVHVVSFML